MLKEDFEKIRLSEKFRALINKSYLISCFLNDDLIKKIWEYNFFSRDNNIIYTFFVDNNEVILKDSSNLLVNKKDNQEELFLNNIQLDEKEVVALVNFFLNKKYKNDKFSKMIISIESSNFILWNITVVLKNLNIINIKINDKTREIIGDKIVSPISKK